MVSRGATPCARIEKVPRLRCPGRLARAGRPPPSHPYGVEKPASVPPTVLRKCHAGEALDDQRG
eukprot:4703826-Pyramimonas_sp.AAC.1